MRSPEKVWHRLWTFTVALAANSGSASHTFAQNGDFNQLIFERELLYYSYYPSY